MDFETVTIVIASVTIILSIIGTGIALAAVIVPGQWDLKRSVGDLRERMARLEGLFEGFTKTPAP